MTDRLPFDLSPPPVCHAHPLREFLSLDLMVPSQSALMERVLDRIERGAGS